MLTRVCAAIERGASLRVRDGVVRLGDVDVRIRPHAELAAEHEGEDARLVRLVGERQQVEEQLRVILERLRHADRRLRHHGDLGAGTTLGLLDAALGAAHVLEVLVEARAIRWPDRAGQIRQVRGDDVEHAPVGPQAGQPLVLGALPPEHPLEDDARVDLHRQRLGRRLPAERVHVGAAVARHARAEERRRNPRWRLRATGTPCLARSRPPPPGRCSWRPGNRCLRCASEGRRSATSRCRRGPARVLPRAWQDC